MIPLSEPVISGNALKYVAECLSTGWVSSVGKFVDKFEAKICEYTGAAHAVACINGTCGLQLALRLCGVCPGDEVIVPTLTFIATANVARYLYAEPIFMDCDDYLNIDCDKFREFCAEECRITKFGLKNKRTGKIIKAVIPVHVFGNPCNMESIMKIARQYRLKVIEDAAESIGAYYTAGVYKHKFTGTISDFGVYSFNGNKIITTGGGGMIVTNNRLLAEKAKYLTNQAKDDSVRYIHNEIGYNFRLTNLQAALGLAQLEQLKDFIKNKKNNYELYKKLLKDIDGVEMLGIPEGTSPNYWFYSLIVDKKKYGTDVANLIKRMHSMSIQARPIWRLNHLQRPYIHNQSYRIEKAFWFWRKILNLPCSSNLTKDEIEKVVFEVRRFKKQGF